ncbi:MAG TPA: hypothetical protein VKT12_03780 [Candidatus Binataceae bacterium]|nr:hypothetical protein [Candidatus Binataceae bacterium]
MLIFLKRRKPHLRAGAREAIDRARNYRAKLLVEVDNLSGLGSGDHIGEVGILVFGHPGRLPLGHAFDPALFFILLLLPAKLFSAAFFQLVAP